MNLRHSKISYACMVVLNHADTINLNKFALSNFSIYFKWKNIKKCDIKTTTTYLKYWL